MKRRLVAMMVLCVWAVTVAGCAFFQQRATLRTSADAYATTVDLLAQYAEQGRLSQEDAARVLAVAEAGRLALDAWDEALETGQSPRVAIARYMEVMAQLVADQEAVEGGDDG